ncbi:MAG: ribosome small subunit-dependent GTPase A [Cyclobacteriaceae bacterium]|nr:ribosome small subunit-dependent GTPase A [Cyclobacteriaceae bacterium]
MNFLDLGQTPFELNEEILIGFTIGRVTQEHRERYIVSTGEYEYEAEITGNFRFTASSRADFPAVGDWVSMTVYDSGVALIHKIFPRKSVLERQTVGKIGEKQIIATNVDVAFIIQSIDNNFNINRLERYLAICYASNIEPVLVISKIDLSDEIEIRQTIHDLESRDRKIKHMLLSNLTKEGLHQIHDFIEKGKTYCVVGSSGVGKSTLINNLLNRAVLRTSEISESTNKGKHTTEHRELFVLENGGIIIDTPGMRELGMTDNLDGIKSTFQNIADLALKCKFPDCRHLDETGCAVIEGLENGTIDGESLDNYRKILREQERFQTSVAEKRKKDRQFGKMAREIMKEKKKSKY